MDRPEIHQLTETVLIGGRERPLTLTSDGRFLWPEGGQRSLSVDREVLGFAADGPRRVKVRALLEEGGGGGGGFCVGGGNVGTGKLVRKELVFEALSEESSKAWCSKLEECIGSLGRPKRLCVILNSFGGKKIAPRIFANDVRPLVEDAGIHIDLRETQYQLHAKEIVHSLGLSSYDGIVCVSGDGILVEVVNGLLEREDWDSAIRMPIGVVPAGTGNGMAKSLLDAVGQPCSPAHATLAIFRDTPFEEIEGSNLLCYWGIGLDESLTDSAAEMASMLLLQVERFSKVLATVVQQLLMSEPIEQPITYNSELVIIFLKFLYNQDPVNDLLDLSKADQEIQIDVDTMQRATKLIEFGGFTDTGYLKRTLVKMFQEFELSFEEAVQMPFSTVSAKIIYKNFLPLFPLLTPPSVNYHPISVSFY